MLREVHSSDSMKTYIAEAYKLGIEFAREVTVYYSRSTYRRLYEAITQPPQLGIDLKISAITSAITEIEKERDTLDSQRLFQVQRRVEDVKKGVDEVRDGVEGKEMISRISSVADLLNSFSASHVQTERRHLGLLREKLLPVGSGDPKDMLVQYSSEVGAVFRNIQRLQSFTFDRLEQEENYRAWSSSRASCMMLLHGKTAVTKTGYSWLSPAIFHGIAQLRAQNRLAIFYLCQDQSFMEKDVPAHVVLSGLILQLLDAKTSILRDEVRYQTLSHSFSDEAWRAARSELPFAVLLELLNLFPEVHIMLDRVDRIKGSSYSFLNSLATLIKECQNKTKIFLVSSSNGYGRIGGKMSADIQEGVEDDLGSERFWSLEWNQ